MDGNAALSGMSQDLALSDELLKLQLRIHRTAEPGIIMATAWEGGYLSPCQSWATRFVRWADMQNHLSEMARMPKKMLERVEKSFLAGHVFDIPVTVRVSELRLMGFERQTA